MKTILITFFLLISSLSSFGQTYVYDQVPLGFNISGAYAFTEESQLLIFSVGASFWGRLGASVGFGKEYGGINGLSSNIIHYDFNALVLKEHFKDFPFSLGVGYQAQRNKVKADSNAVFEGIKIKSNSFYLQAVKQLYKSDDFNYYLGFMKGFGNLTLQDSSSDEKKKLDYVSTSLTIHSKRSFVYLRPTYLWAYDLKNLSQLTIAFGMIW